MTRILRRRLLGGGVALAAGATVAGGWLAGKRAAGASLGGLRPLAPPVVLPEATFTAANGQLLRLADFRGHPLVLNVWATWCGPCIAEMPALDAMARELRPEGIAVIPIAVDFGGVKAVRAFYRTHHIRSLPIYAAPGGGLLDAWNIGGIPVTWLIDREGRAIARADGAQPWLRASRIGMVRRLLGPKPA